MTLPRQPKRRWPKLVIAMALLVIAAIMFAPSIIAKSGLRNTIVAKATSDLRGSVTVDSLTLGWFSPVEAVGITIRDDTGQTIASVESINTDKTLLSLVRDFKSLGTITIVKPVMMVIAGESETNLERLLETILKKKSNPDTAMQNLKIIWADGKVTIRDEKSAAEQVFHNVVGEATIGTASRIAMKASVMDPAGSLDLEGEFGATKSLNIQWNSIPIATAGWLARRFEPGLATGGTATGTARITSNAANSHVTGTIRVANTDFSTARIAPDRVTSGIVNGLFDLSWVGSTLSINHADVSADFGRLSFVGTINPSESLNSLLSRPGLSGSADIDLAKLVTMLPTTVKLQTGTTIQSGRLTAQVSSKALSDGRTVCEGSLKTTPLMGTRDGKSLNWESPIIADFVGRLDVNQRPTFDKLTMQSDFVALNAKGSMESFEAAANVDLSRLRERLGQFFDLGNIRLAGTGTFRGSNRKIPGAMAIDLKGDFQNIHVSFDHRFDWRDPILAVAFRGILSGSPDGVLGLESGIGSINAGGDSLTVEFTESIPKLTSIDSASANVTLNGDLKQWKVRLGDFLGIPREWQTAGLVTAKASAQWRHKSLKLESVDAGGRNLVFRGAGMTVDEPAFRLKADRAIYSVATAKLDLQNLHMGTESIDADAIKLTIAPGENPPKADGQLTVNAARLNRIQRILGWSGEPIDGMAKGTVQLSTVGQRIRIDADLVAEQVRYGPTTRPTWQESWVKLAALGILDFPSETMTIERIKVERDGLFADVKGSLSEFSKSQTIDLKGTLNYDLAKLEPQLKEYLGKGGKLAGKDSRPFSIRGPLAEGVEKLNAAVGGNRLLVPGLVGQGAASWQSVRAYGFDVGPAELKVNLAHGMVSFDEIRVQFGGGQVNAKPALKLNPGRFDLSIAPGRIIKNAKLTPAVCADALGYALPAIANSTEAQGLISFELTESAIPLVDYQRMIAKGNLILHTVTVTPGPIIRELLAAANVTEPTFSLAKEQSVPVWVENGRVHHRNLALTGRNASFTTNGSVGFDGSLQLIVDMPVPIRLIEQAFKNNPRIKEALQKKMISISFGGTVNRPTLDARAMQASLQKLVGDASRDALNDAAGGLLQKELDKSLEKLLQKKKP